MDISIKKGLGKRGTTLVELIVSLGIMTLLLAPVSYMLFASYNQFFEENDRMIALQSASEAMEKIIIDLRKEESIETVFTNTTLTINSGLIYSYDNNEKDIKLNGNSIFTDENIKVNVNDFTVTEILGEVVDSWILSIEMNIEIGKSGNINLRNMYKRRYHK